MKKILLYIFQYSLLWMLFFAFARTVFFTIQVLFGKQLSLNLFAKSLFYGLKLDLSLTAYLLVPMVIVFICYQFFQKKVLLQFIRYYSYFLGILFSVIYAIDSELYQDWGFRIDNTVLMYLDKSNEAIHFINVKMIFVFLFCFFILFIFIFYGLKKIIHSIPTLSKKIYGLYLFILLAFLLIPMRGGIQQIPIKVGSVYFSENTFANHLAINPIWNIIYGYSQSIDKTNDIHFMDSEIATQLAAKLFPKNDSSSISILNDSRPTIFIFILESFTAFALNERYQNQEITPRLNELIKKGIFFDQAYSTGDRTDKGVVAVLSGYPAQAQTSIMMEPNKTEKLPSLIKELKKENYHSHFFYGGESDFASLKSYLLNIGMEEIIDKSNFPRALYNAKWGVHDHLLFDKVLESVKDDTGRNINVILSLSSHPPYDLPVESIFKGNKEVDQFLSSMHYTDESLGKLIDQMKDQGIWNKSFIVFVADHGGRFPDAMTNDDPRKFKITMLFTGGAVKQDSVIHTLSCQTDISKTILRQLNLPSESFEFSQDLLNYKKKPYAYYAFNNGFGFIDSTGSQIFSNDTKTVIETSGKPSISVEETKAFYQKLMEDFEKR
ncbi:MAG: LTA synthase family protein [Saprospiraceae bacterium]